VEPIPVARAQGIYFWAPEGKRFIDYGFFFTNGGAQANENAIRIARVFTTLLRF
jgi:4-aminobutyrate aminotransferase-like enzyme